MTSNVDGVVERVLLLLGLLVVVFAPVAGAYYADKKWRETHPTHKNFIWGFFQAIVWILVGVALMIYPICKMFASLQLSDAVAYIMWFAWGAIFARAGYALLTLKSRWAWIAVLRV